MRSFTIAAVAASACLLAGGAPAALAAPAGAAVSAPPARLPGPALTIPGADFGGVAAVSGKLAWAAGSLAVGTEPRTVFQPLILRWNGTTWAQAASPDPVSGGSLSDVAALPTGEAWAVGSSGGKAPGQPTRALIEHWDGTAWTQVPNPAPTGSGLLAVTVTSASSAWAVGNITRPGGLCPCRVLIEHWDGLIWTMDPTPHVAGGSLSGVAATSARNAWAVGRHGQQALIEHWNGGAWRRVRVPRVTGAELLGVTALSARSAWAVGDHGGGEQHPSRALIEHWDGTAWARVPGPATPPFSSLGAVTARTSRDAWAVGNFDGGALIEHWDGTAWKLRIPGGADATAYSLSGVTATSPRNAWTAGLDGAHGGLGLILRWNGRAWR